MLETLAALGAFGLLLTFLIPAAIIVAVIVTIVMLAKINDKLNRIGYLIQQIRDNTDE